MHTTCRHLEMENPSEALPLIKESLDGRRQTLGDDHINTLNSISLLSEVYADMRVRPKPRQNNRFKTPTAFRCALWYALVLLHGCTLTRGAAACGQEYGSALPLAEEALAGHRSTLGNEHADTLVSSECSKRSAAVAHSDG